MKFQVYSSINNKFMGNLNLAEKPPQGEYVAVGGSFYRVEKVIHVDANQPFILHVCP